MSTNIVNSFKICPFNNPHYSEGMSNLQAWKQQNSVKEQNRKMLPILLYLRMIEATPCINFSSRFLTPYSPSAIIVEEGPLALTPLSTFPPHKPFETEDLLLAE